MTTFKQNEYIELYNPAKYNYFTIRILSKSENGYNALILDNRKKEEIYSYAIETYGFRRNFINRELFVNAGFTKDNLVYTKNDLVVFECLIGKLEQDPYYLYNNYFSSRFLGYAFLKENELNYFKTKLEKIQFKTNADDFKKEFNLSSSVLEFFNFLIRNDPDFDSLEKLDNLYMKTYQ